MSNRLNQEREERLQPKRVQSTFDELKSMGFEPEIIGAKRIDFEYNGMKVQFWPYSGWHTGKSIKDGRGFKNLKKQLK